MKNDKYKIYTVIVCQPFAFAKFNLLGRTVSDYSEYNFKDYPHCTVSCDKNITVTAKYDYLAVVYANMPLVTAEFLQKVARTMNQKRIKKINLGCGYMVEYGVEQGCFSKYSLKIPDILSINDTESLNIVYNVLKSRIIDKHIKSGAIILDRDNTVIDDTAIIEQGAIIEPFCIIKGKTIIKANAKVCSFSVITDSLIMKDVVIRNSAVEQSIIGKNTKVGPFSYIRSDCEIGSDCRIGDFVEIKKSKIGNGVKSAHLAYIGDAEVGDKTNIGCGTVFANYDGKIKHKTIVGENVFVGANTNLVAPLNIGNNVFIAAGTTVTENIADNKFCIGRVNQDVRENKIKIGKGI